MSQRLHIGATSKEFYDCVLTSADGAKLRLLDEWLMYDNGFYWTPFKIRIGDMELWQEVEPVVSAVVTGVGLSYPDDVWMFYHGKDHIEHPSAEELKMWIGERKQRDFK